MVPSRLANVILRLGAALPLLAGSGCGGDLPAGPDAGPGPGSGTGAHYETIETFAGTGVNGLSADGLDPLLTDFSLPMDLSFGPDDRPYILDWNNHRVRTIRGGVIETVIGSGELGNAPEGVATESGLNHPTSAAFDRQGRLILAAWHNSKVMRWDPATGMLERICGDGSRSYGGDGGPAIDAVLDLPVAAAVDALGRIYITDQANNRIRRIELDGTIDTVVGTGEKGFSGDGGPASLAQISLPNGQSAPPVGGLAFAPNGDLFLADYNNNRVRRIRPVGNDYVIDTVAGNGDYAFAGDGGPATDASLRGPADVAVDSAGILYITDTFTGCIRKVDAEGIITTFAGQPEHFGFAGDGGPPAEALLDRPYGIAFNTAGDLFIVDTYNQRIRVIRR